MQILYAVHQFFPRNYTGTERFTLNLASQMQRMAHSPTVLTYERSRGEQGFKHLHGNVEIKRYVHHSIPVISLRDNSLRDDFQALSQGRPEIFHSGIEKGFNKLGLEFDVVHVCHPMWLSSVARACKNQKIPIVLTLTDPWLLCPREILVDRQFRLCNGPEAGRKCILDCGYNARITERYEDALRLLSMADQVVTSSKFTASLFNRNGWNKNIRIIPHSVDYRFARVSSFDPDNISFGYIGTISWHKGLHVLIKAFQKAPQSKLRLKVYGSTHQNPAYAEEVLSLARGDDRIQFLGTFEMEAMAKIMGEISVLVVPSVYYENYPLVMLMALACKVPVIASNIGGMPEVIKHGINGFLFKTGNSDELKSLVDEIARKPETIQELRERIVPPRRVEEEALEYENIYMDLASK